MKVETVTTAVDTQKSRSHKRKHHKTVGTLVLVFGMLHVLVVRQGYLPKTKRKKTEAADAECTPQLVSIEGNMLFLTPIPY